MSTVNLLPRADREKRQRYLRNYYTLLTGGILLAGVIVLTVLLLLFDQLYRLNLANAEAAKVQATQAAANYLDVEKQAAELSKQLNVLKQAGGMGTKWAALLVDLQTITPPGVAIKQIEIQGPEGGAASAASNKAKLNGTADSRRSVAEFQVALASRPYFKNVELETTTKADQTVEYTISFEANFDKLKGSAK